MTAGEERSDVGCVLWCCCWYVVNDNLIEAAYHALFNSHKTIKMLHSSTSLIGFFSCAKNDISFFLLYSLETSLRLNIKISVRLKYRYLHIYY